MISNYGDIPTDLRKLSPWERDFLRCRLEVFLGPVVTAASPSPHEDSRIGFLLVGWLTVSDDDEETFCSPRRLHTYLKKET